MKLMVDFLVCGRLYSVMIVRVSTYESRRCPFCDYSLDGCENFEEACNHLTQVHSLKCLHVGQETHHGDSGEPWHSTVAVFGD